MSPFVDRVRRGNMSQIHTAKTENGSNTCVFYYLVCCASRVVLSRIIPVCYAFLKNKYTYTLASRFMYAVISGLLTRHLIQTSVLLKPNNLPIENYLHKHRTRNAFGQRSDIVSCVMWANIMYVILLNDQALQYREKIFKPQSDIAIIGRIHKES